MRVGAERWLPKGGTRKLLAFKFEHKNPQLQVSSCAPDVYGHDHANPRITSSAARPPQSHSTPRRQGSQTLLANGIGGPGLFEESDDLASLAQDVDTILTAARVHASISNGVSSRGDASAVPGTHEHLRASLQTLLDRIDKSLLYHTSQNYPHLSTLHKTVQAAHEHHSRAVAPKLTQLARQLTELQQSLNSKIEALQSKFDYRASVSLRKSLLDCFASAHSTMEKIEGLLYDQPGSAAPKSIQVLAPVVFDNKLGAVDSDWQPLWRACHLYNELLLLKEKTITIYERTSSARVAGDALPFWIAMNERIIRSKAALLSSTDSLFDLVFPLSAPQAAAMAHPRDSVLLACLRAYELLRAHHHIEHRLITGANASNTQSRIAQLFAEALASQLKSTAASSSLNVAPFFDSLVVWMRGNVEPLLALVAGHLPDANATFHFALRGIWMPLFKFLSIETPLTEGILKGVIPASVFSSRKSQVFHDNYLAFLAFTDHIESIGPTLQHIQAFRQHNDYKAFFRRWDLDTYFGLRKVEIASSIEGLLSSDGASQPSESKKSALSATVATEKALALCFDPTSTFLVRLAHNLLKLALQIVERYSKWSLSVIEANANAQGVEKLLRTLADAESLAARLEATETGEFLPVPTNGSFVQPLVPIVNPSQLQIIRKSLSIAGQRLRADLTEKVEPYVLDYLFGLCVLSTANPMATGSGGCDLVAQVRSIRALFQVPGRPKPTQPLSYARNLLQPLFNALLNPTTQNPVFFLVSETLRRSFARATIERIASQFADLAAQLADAQAADKSATSGYPSATRALGADGDKVLAQLALDVEEVSRQVRTVFHMSDLEAIPALKRLLHIVGKN